MAAIEEALAQAKRHHQAGAFQEAERICLQILNEQAEYPEALHLLGVLAHQRGNSTAAVELIGAALHHEPGNATYLCNLAKCCQRLGRRDDALTLLRQAVQAQPSWPPGHYELGLELRGRGQLHEAVDSLRRAVELQPSYVQAHYALGQTEHRLSNLEQAAACYRETLRLQPNHVEARSALGAALAGLGRFQEAIEILQQTLAVKPDHAVTHGRLAKTWRLLGQAEKAEAAFRAALRVDPDLAEAHYGLGEMLADQQRHEEALNSFRAGMRLRRPSRERCANLAYLLNMLGESGEAISLLEQGLRTVPDDRLRVQLKTLLPPVYASTDDLQACRARLQEGLKELRAGGVTVDLTDRPTWPLFFLAYQGQDDRELQCAFARLHRAPSPPLVPRARAAGEKIRVGFLSSYFRQHTIGYLTQGLIAQLSREQFVVTVLRAGVAQDSVASAIRAGADTFLEVPRDLPAARQLIADQRLDVLYYPDIGMDPFTHALAFSRLAPVQCVSWGHPDTTGIGTIDYFISSEALETVEAEQAYTETLVRLPDLAVYYHRPELSAEAGSRAEFGLTAEDHVYACPQSLFKFHLDFDKILAGILRGDPRGVLVLTRGPNAYWERLLRKRFARTLPEFQERVRVLPAMPREVFLRLLAQADVLLDPLHFGGGNTSYEGLAAGTPIVTLPSSFLRGRITYALYRQMGMMDCVVGSPQEYVELALKIGMDCDYRESLRQKIFALNGVLYENAAGVRQLERFLIDAVTKRNG
jgi:predicted O-linked N-acetylglucosamine transferase (SPINDLY family)